MTQITNLPFNKPLKILGFNACDKQDQQQLVKMGMIPGTLITLIRRAPLGDPIEICIRNTQVAFSKALLKKLQLGTAS